MTVMASLFERDKSTVSRHIKNVSEEGELERDSVVANFATTAADGKTYKVDYYNLDIIISVGYRVKSLRGTQFRKWATSRLNEYIRKGFTMDDERLKNGGGRYFRELLQRIRDIRSSERNLYQQVTDIYGKHINAEVQVGDEHNMERRSVFYISRLYTDQMKPHMKFSDICPAIAINILDFPFLPFSEYHNRYRLKNTTNNHELTDVFEVNFLELPKVPVMDLKSSKDLWMRFFTANDEETRFSGRCDSGHRQAAH